MKAKFIKTSISNKSIKRPPTSVFFVESFKIWIVLFGNSIVCVCERIEVTADFVPVNVSMCVHPCLFNFFRLLGIPLLIRLYNRMQSQFFFEKKTPKINRQL